MSFWTRIYYRLLNLPIKLLVKIQPIPLEPVPELSLNTKKHIFYVLPYDSKADLLALRKSCRELGLEDPLQPLNIHGHKLPHFIFLDKGPRVFNYLLSKESTRQSFHHVIALHQQYPDLDVQMLPVSVMFGRSPGKEGSKPPSLRLLNGVQKFFAVLLDGRQCFVRYSDTVSFRQIADNLGTELSTAHKLVRVARIHFYRQRLAALGPKLPDRKVMFEKLLKSPAIEKALEDEIKSKKITPNKAQKNARNMLNEIAADFTYRMIRLTGHVLSWTWSRLYQGLKVSNIESIRKLAQEGHGIVYAPCHRSHMDYLLLSYVLYKQGLVPPHIAAGVNLNFWPAGPLFRRLGAFFIRRTFKDKLYTAVFREYFAELFYRGYSVEYFIEGGRSRTGRLLDPKTGTLTMTIQSMLRGDMRSIMIVPVYIGYEHVMEVGTYAKELRGAEKKKESLWQILKALPRLKRLGFGYVNFGEPISLTNYLNKHAPQWRESIDPIEPQRPSWLLPTSIKLSEEIMERINRAAAVNAMNLCCTALLASRQRALTKEMLESQINCYLALLRNVKYSKPVTIPDLDAPSLIAHATQMNKFNIEHDSAGGIIRLSREQAVLSTYYRNNVQHLFAIPSLVASIIMNKICIKREELINDIICLYPFLKAELFIHFKSEELTDYIQAIVNELLNQSLIVEKEGVLSVRHANIITLQLLAAGIRETAQRYAIAFSLMYYNPKISRVELERESRLIAHRLSILHGINAPEFFDKGVFAILINTLRKEKYLTSEELEPEKIYRLLDLVCQLLTPDVKQTIKSVSLKEVAQLPLPEVETDIKIDADIGAEIKPEPDKTPSK